MVSHYLQTATGRDDLTAHSLRHSCATFLISDGMNAKSLQALLGHSSLLTTQRYAQLLAPDTAPIEQASSIFSDILPTTILKRKEEKQVKKRGRPRKEGTANERRRARYRQKKEEALKAAGKI